MNGTTCPRCRRASDTVTRGCPGCGADLSALYQLVDLADRHFNDGLRAARAGRWADAGEHLAVTLALSPDDVEATVAAARVAVRQDRPERALALVEHAARLAPERTDLDALTESIALTDRSAAPGPAGPHDSGGPEPTSSGPAPSGSGSRGRSRSSPRRGKGRRRRRGAAGR